MKMFSVQKGGFPPVLMNKAELARYYDGAFASYMIEGEDFTVTEVDEDPTPWCHQCGAQTEKQCDCGPIAENN